MMEECHHLCGLRIGGCGAEHFHLVTPETRTTDRYLALCTDCRALRDGKTIRPKRENEEARQ